MSDIERARAFITTEMDRIRRELGTPIPMVKSIQDLRNVVDKAPTLVSVLLYLDEYIQSLMIRVIQEDAQIVRENALKAELQKVLDHMKLVKAIAGVKEQ